MKAKKEILFIIPSMNGGGAERVLINLFNLIDLKQFNINLYVIEEKGMLWDKVPAGINKNLLFSNKYISKIATLLYRRFSFKGLFKFYGKKIKGSYDVGISFLDSIHTEFLFINNATINKKVVMIHSSYKSYPQKLTLLKDETYKNKVLERYKNVDSIISVSNESLYEFKLLFGNFKDMRVIYNPINKKDIFIKANSYIPFQKKNGVFNFIAIGSLIPVKGFDLLIEACKYLIKDNIKFEVNIIGDGQLYDSLNNQIKDSSLTNNIFLRGFKDNPYPWIKHSHALIMTSISEGLPTVLCEALSLGIPTITPNVPGCRELVNDGEFGLVFERNSKALSIQMKKIMTNERIVREYSLKSLKRSKIFDDTKVLNEYYKLFNS